MNKYAELADLEWLDDALPYYEKEKSQNPDYLTFDYAMIRTFARRIVGQIKEQIKLYNEQCEVLERIFYNQVKNNG